MAQNGNSESRVHLCVVFIVQKCWHNMLNNHGLCYNEMTQTLDDVTVGREEDKVDYLLLFIYRTGKTSYTHIDLMNPV